MPARVCPRSTALVEGSGGKRLQELSFWVSFCPPQAPAPRMPRLGGLASDNSQQIIRLERPLVIGAPPEKLQIPRGRYLAGHGRRFGVPHGGVSF